MRGNLRDCPHLSDHGVIHEFRPSFPVAGRTLRPRISQNNENVAKLRTKIETPTRPNLNNCQKLSLHRYSDVASRCNYYCNVVAIVAPAPIGVRDARVDQTSNPPRAKNPSAEIIK